jgi:RNA polymerase sigma factor (sigma-70 family)
MNPQQWQTEQFEQNRDHLRAVAYRMLGSGAEADDAVQEAWLRVGRSDTDAVENMRGWLTTIVSRICLDMLRTRRARREEPADDWPPEPVSAFELAPDPEQEVLLAESVGLALLVVLEKLTPGERLAFVLHDMFGFGFEEIAPVLERSVPATRQLASRARRRVRGANTDAVSSRLAQQRTVIDAFLAASRGGDFEALVAVLDPDVSLRSSRTSFADATPISVSGRAEVARRVLQRGSQFAHLARPAIVDGNAGVVVALPKRVLAVVKFGFAGDRLRSIDVTVHGVPPRAA